MGFGIGMSSYYYLESRAKDKASKEEKLPEKKPEEEPKEEKETIELKTEDKVKINEKLNSTLYPALLHGKKFLVDFNGKNISLLGSQMDKFYFVTEVLRTMTSKVEFDYQYQDDVKGEARVLKTDYQQKYQDVFGKTEQIPSVNGKIREENQYIYFDYVTNWGAPDFALKVHSLEKLGMASTMTIYLYSDITNEVINNETVMTFLEMETVPENYLKGILTLTYEEDLVKILSYKSMN